MNHKTHRDAAVWFLAIRAGTGADIFTLRLCEGLNARGIRAEIMWLPHRAEYLSWTVPVPAPPEWATLAHVSTWLPPRFVPHGLPVVATLHHSVHDPALRRYKGFARAAYHRCWIAPLECRTMRRANQVIAVSRFAADMARQALCNVPMQVIHNGIDTTRFHPVERRSVGKPFQLLYVGSWMARKGVDLLAPIMRDLGDDFILRYTGRATAANDEYAMPPNMIDIGRLSNEQVVKAMQHADAFLFPSRSEGFGLVAAEAMACGLPVIATRGSSLPEVVEDGVTGLLCPQDDVAAFVHAIRRLAADSKLWQEMSLNAVARVHRMFSEDSALAAYLQVYRDVLDAFNGETP